MLKNENIVCISSIDWDFIWQIHQEFISALAKRGNRVLFIENTGARMPAIRDIPRIKNRIKNWFKGVKGIRQESENIFIFSPLVLPFPYSRIAVWINRFLILPILAKWTKLINFDSPIAIVFLPTPLSLEIIEALANKVIVYYCVDSFAVSSKSAEKIKNSEISLLKKADLVFATSSQLYDYCAKYNNNTHIISGGVNFEEFQEIGRQDFPVPKELSNIPGPIIGYVGGIHKWLDQKLIKDVALMCPQYSFVFIGPVQTDISVLKDIKNIFFLEKMSHRNMVSLMKYFDAGIIPYIVSEYTRSVYPNKLNEYHALGKPVISTPLPEIIKFNREFDNLVFVAGSSKEFAGQVMSSIKIKDKKLIDSRIASAKSNSWLKKADEAANLIEGALEKKRSLSDWRKRFLNFYKLSRKKIPELAIAGLCIYLLVFYTPLVWFLAEPLKLSQNPQKADALVVFAGGVGESGLAGQSYEERVKYAVELYKDGFASHIIFSSGYMHAFKEPVVMRALALSMGVPDEAIILEDKAKNTYENVKFTRKILANKEWKKILLISSPFHMRRARLVFEKNAPELKVIYTPLPDSQFYNRKFINRGKKSLRQISLKQIEGILHEYIGIIYYWCKGYV